MRAIFSPSKLCGEIAAIPSKSDVHRALICAALSNSETLLQMSDFSSEDIRATIRCLGSLGAAINKVGQGLSVSPITTLPQNPLIDCGESGSTLRFMLPVVAAMGCGGTFVGSGRLPERPITPLLNALRERGIDTDKETLPLTLKGKLTSGVFNLPGNVSSQFISGLLLALPLVDGGGEIRLTTPLESVGYVNMTLETMRKFGADPDILPLAWKVSGDGFTSPGQYSIDGDWSNAAFFLAGGALGQAVTVSGLSEKSFQKDKQISPILQRFGSEVSVSDNKLSHFSSTLTGIGVLDISEIPDLVPILAVVAALSPGETLLANGSRLRIKESDRLRTVAQMLSSLGADIREGTDYLVINGKQSLSGGQVVSSNDHRLAMAAAIAATRCTGEVVLDGAQAINKSYPNFYEHYRQLGGIVDLTD